MLLCWGAETGCKLWTLLFLPGNEGNRVNSLFQGRNHGKVWASLGILALILSVTFFNFAFTEIFLSQTGIALQAKGSAAGKSFETLGRWMKQFLPHPREHTLIPWSQNTSKNPQVLEFKHLLVEQKHKMKESSVFFLNFQHWYWAPVLKSAWSHLLSQVEKSLTINKPQWGVLFQTQLPKRDRNKFLSHFKGFTHLWHQWVLTHRCSKSHAKVSLFFLLIFLFLLTAKNIPPVSPREAARMDWAVRLPHRRRDVAAGEIQLENVSSFTDTSLGPP